MHVEVVRSTRVIVQVAGEVDLSNADSLSACLEDAIRESPTGFIVDMSDVGYIDSAGIAAIMAAYQRLRLVGGRIALVVADLKVKELLALVHPEMLPGFLMCDDVDCALRKMES